MPKIFHLEFFFQFLYSVCLGEKGGGEEKGMVVHRRKSLLVVVETPTFTENN